MTGTQNSRVNKWTHSQPERTSTDISVMFFNITDKVFNSVKTNSFPELIFEGKAVLTSSDPLKKYVTLVSAPSIILYLIIWRHNSFLNLVLTTVKRISFFPPMYNFLT